MLFLKHDFYSNFSSSVDAGDNNSIIDMVANEVSELIVYKRDELIEFLGTVGVEVKSTQSDEKIIDKILGGFPKNIKLIKGLAFLVYQNNIQQMDDKSPAPDRTTIYRKIDMISSGIMGIGDSFEYHPQLKKEFKNDLLNKVEAKSKAVGDRKIKIRENASGKYWFWGAVVVIITAGAYLIVKYKDKIIIEEKPTIDPTPPITPEASVTPEATLPQATETPVPQVQNVQPVASDINTTTELPPQAVI